MLKKLIGPLLIVVAFAIVVLLVKNKPRPETKPTTSKQAITLLVAEKYPEKHPFIIPAEGFISSRWQSTLSSRVSGEVTQVSEKLLLGNQFKKDDVLLKIDPIDYQVQLSRSEANFRTAEANLIEQEMQAERAKNDWAQLNPNRQASDFNLRIPQLKSAQANLNATKEELKLAIENLSRTEIKAPFDGFSTSRSVSLGDQIQASSVVAQIVDSTQLELKISLTVNDASLVEKAQSAGAHLKASSVEVDDIKTSMLLVDNTRFEPFIDKQNRWRSLILELSNENHDLMIGDFISLSIVLDQTEELLVIPESALSTDGQIWYVDDNSKAESFLPQIKYKNNGMLYLAINPQIPLPVSLVISPPNSLLRGTVVNTDLWQPSDTSE